MDLIPFIYHMGVLENIGIDSEDLLLYIRNALSDMNSILAGIRVVPDNGGLQPVPRLTHGIKSIALSIGAVSLTAAAKLSGGASDETAEACYRNLEREFRRPQAVLLEKYHGLENNPDR